MLHRALCMNPKLSPEAGPGQSQNSISFNSAYELAPWGCHTQPMAPNEIDGHSWVFPTLHFTISSPRYLVVYFQCLNLPALDMSCRWDHMKGRLAGHCLPWAPACRSSSVLDGTSCSRWSLLCGWMAAPSSLHLSGEP